jgi:hypothetical protein
VRCDAGDHDVLDIIAKEKSGLLSAECIGEWVGITDGCRTRVAVRHTTDERPDGRPLGMGAVQGRCTIVHSSSRNRIPIPCRSNVVLMAL